MNLKPGDVVILKSGGHPLTVAEVHEDAVACVWMGGEGDLFRETLPLAVLELAEIDTSEDEEDGEEDEDEEEDDEEEDAARKKTKVG
jgi:uncharacterized protein YodC (DUF2158 family)